MTVSDDLPASAAGPAVQLAHRALAQALDRREFPAGSRLPGERALAQRLGVSRSSLRLALAGLEREGRVHASAQRGWFVSTEMVSEPPSLLKSFTDIARDRGLTPTARVLGRRVRLATYEEAVRLRIAPASEVVEIIRVRGLDSVPVCLDTTVVIRGRAPALETADLENGSLFAFLEEAGVYVLRSNYTAHADAADAHTAEVLRVSAGSPVLIGEEVTFDRSEVPVLLGRAVYRGDAYRFETTLHRGTE
ncbi:GntR family transcriptional regulator [Streptomyces sp. SID3343]|uniref:UTRA domain-containing protein n=1 Tax=Streptomyces sp. SID3343 TaxID=2690260 RepID=UPI0013706CAF|nr:UTRA domain-containing protein [Streptomyces sp. SID3343]